MKRFTKLFLALALLSTPVTFTSCDSSYYEEYGVSLVDNAINDFIASRLSRDYRTAYNWFWYHYPEATNYEFDQFMSAILVGFPNDAYWDDYNSNNYRWNNYYNNEINAQNNDLLAEAQALTGEWIGRIQYEYTDEQTNLRKVDQFTANMKFFQYNSAVNSVSGNGVEIDMNDKGETNTLEFAWYINTDGSIYIKYKRTGTIFILDASKQKFHLGTEVGKSVDTFFGDAYSSNTTDYMKIDLERASSRASVGKKTTRSFGGATKNTFSDTSVGVANQLHIR
ncbi:hypothetical protein [Prevotella bivia]|uniref:hypothetical protein n=1 Tax=Prevotella bivia TaxID=28125 RepID=UPI00254EA506|nr:hypothetical protein [Prevotella bivia]MDZ3817773.1 hypothetical protein [Prevotella bivia]